MFAFFASVAIHFGMNETHFVLYESAAVAVFALVTGVASGSNTGDEKNDDVYELHTIYLRDPEMR